MKQSKDPFEAALEEQEESNRNPEPSLWWTQYSCRDDDYDDIGSSIIPLPLTLTHHSVPLLCCYPLVLMLMLLLLPPAAITKNKECDHDEEEENADVELGKFPSSSDPAKMAKMQAILSQFTEDQMSRYESFRRSALQKSNMRRKI